MHRLLWKDKMFMLRCNVYNFIVCILVGLLYFDGRALKHTGINAEEYDDFPLNYDVTLEGSSSHVTLRLKRSLDVHLIPVYTIKNGGVFRQNMTVDKSTPVYVDVTNEAIVTVTCGNITNDDNSTCTDPIFYGIFAQNNTWFTLENTYNSSSYFNEQSDVVYKRSTRQRLYTLHAADSTHGSKGVSLYYTPKFRRKRQTEETTKKIYSIELVYVISYDLYISWLERSRLPTLEEKEVEATYNIHRYFAIVAEGVNLRYVNIGASDFSVVVRLVAIIIATTVEDSTWTESLKRDKTIEGSRALPLFGFWAHINEKNIVEYDHLQLVTGYDIYGYGKKATIGLAYNKGMCRDSRSASIMEDTSDIMRTITASAHEIAHSLGVKHDGKSNSCNPADNYLMSPNVGSSNLTIRTNLWLFSNCSVENLRQLFQQYGSTTYRCLSNQPSTSRTSVWEQFTLQLPGQVYTPDEQCKLIYGDASQICRSIKHEPSLLCTTMWCEQSGGTTCQRHHAARGSSCGHKKWCIDGSCQYDKAAPSARAACLFGNVIGDVFHGWTCERLVTRWKFLCDMKWNGIKWKCCDSCRIFTRRKRNVKK